MIEYENECLYDSVYTWQYCNTYCITVYHRKISKAWWYKRKMQKKEGQNVAQGIITGVSYKVSTTVVGINDCESSAWALKPIFFFFMISTCNVNVQCMSMQVGNLVVKQVLNLRDTFSVVFLWLNNVYQFELIVAMTMWRRRED